MFGWWQQATTASKGQTPDALMPGIQKWRSPSVCRGNDIRDIFPQRVSGRTAGRDRLHGWPFMLNPVRVDLPASQRLTPLGRAV
jgi:hypothetical protein